MLTAPRSFDGPTMARPALVTWQAGGRQEFPNDPVLERARYLTLKAKGLVTIRRRPAQAVAHA